MEHGFPRIEGLKADKIIGSYKQEGKNMSGRLWSQEIYIKAFRFAAKAHNGQTVTDTELPYITHISLVCMEVIACLEAEECLNGDLAVQCALLHDVLEDTSVPYSEIEAAFGKDVAVGVLALTKNSAVAKGERMADSLQRIRQQPKAVWLVKLADRITNLAPPPSHWDKVKINQYREEAIEIYNALCEASGFLSQRLILKIAEYQQFC
jgi:(p)ppGpp synthase/HD superfamily hydrolase